MKHKLFLILIVILSAIGTLVIPSAARNLFAQDASPSIFDEGTETTIRPEDIGDDVRLWAQNTALKLKELLREIKKLNTSEKRDTLVKIIQESVEEAQNTKELLLMRFTLNRALRFNELFGQEEALAVNNILIPAV